MTQAADKDSSSLAVYAASLFITTLGIVYVQARVVGWGGCMGGCMCVCVCVCVRARVRVGGGADAQP